MLWGREVFVRDTKETLSIRAVGREVTGANGSYELREPKSPYEADFGLKNGDLREENTLANKRRSLLHSADTNLNPFGIF